MPIELPKEARAQAIVSIERWFQTERDERVGNVHEDEFSYWRQYDRPRT